jgi:hypothetical protein
MPEMDPLEEANASEDPIAALNKRKGWTGTDEEPAAPAVSKPSFKEAFASARRAGDKTFEWNGKKFTTELATEKKPAPRAEPKAEAEKQAPKAPLRQETMQERAESYVAKRAAQRAADAAAKSAAAANKPAVAIPSRGRIDTSRVNPNTLLPMKKGGVTASRRADGIASRGKTRGKIY